MRKMDKANKLDIKRRLWGCLLHYVAWTRETGQDGTHRYLSGDFGNVSFSIDGNWVKVYVSPFHLVDEFWVIPFSSLWWHVRKMKRYVDNRETRIFNESIRERL